jgi:hypothetical protein
MNMMLTYVVMTEAAVIVDSYDDAQDAFSRRASYNNAHIWGQANPCEVYEWVDEPASHRRYLRLVDRVAMMRAMIAESAQS